MSTNDSLSNFLRQARQSVAATQGEQTYDTPIGEFLAHGITPSQLSQTRITAKERFAEGIGRGVIYPVRSVVGGGDDSFAVPNVLRELSSLDPEAGIAGTAGEFVGMALSFIPFWRGATTVTAGVGMLKGVPRLKQVIDGAVSFGAFEALAGETVNEAPSRFLHGLVEGAGFELGLVGIASAWRKRFPRLVDDTLRKEAELFEEVAEDVAIHPDGLKIERWFAPGDETLEVTIAKLQAVANEAGTDANLYQALARVVKTHMPGGNIVIPLVHDLEGIKKFADEHGYKFSAFLNAEAEGLDRFSILFVDTNKSLLNIKDPELSKVFMGEGLPTLTVDQAVDLIREQGVLDVTTFTRSDPNASGYWDPKDLNPSVVPEIALFNWGQRAQTPLGYFSLVVHEFMHDLHYRATGRKYLQFSAPPLTDLFSTAFEEVPAVARSNVLETLTNELKGVAEEVLTIKRVEKGWPNTRARQDAKERIRLSESYYHTPEELVARLAELMFLDPKKAKSLAPLGTKLLSDLILERSPKMKELMSKQASVIDDVLKEFWVKRSGKLTVWQEGRPKLTDHDMRQFGKTGFFDGMGVFVDGKQGAVMGSVKESVMVRMSDSGHVVEVPRSRVSIPTVPVVLKKEQKILDAIRGVLDKKPGWVGVTLRDFTVEAAEHPQGILRRAMVDLKDFEIVTNFRRWLKELPPEQAQMFTSRTEIVGGPDPRAMIAENWGPRFTQNDQLAILDWIRTTGKKGFALLEGGELHLAVPDRSAVTLGDEVSMRFARTFGGTERIVGTTDDLFVRVDPDETFRAILRQEGVLEQDLPYFVERTKELYGERLFQSLSTETKATVESVENATKNLHDDAAATASRAGFDIVDVGDGVQELRDSSTKSLLGRFASSSEAADYASRAGYASDEVIAEFPGAKAAGGGSGPPPPQAQAFPQSAGSNPPPVSKLRKGSRGSSLVDAHFLLGASISALENFAKVAQRRGLGPVYDRVFLPAQRAIFRVEEQLADVKRELLGGLTFAEGLQGLEKFISKINKGRHPIITNYVEYLSKEEIARPGGLLQRGMTTNEIRVAAFLQKAGLQNDVPRLMSLDRLIESGTASQAKLERTILRMRQIQLSPEAQELLQVFESLPRYSSRTDYYKALGVTKDEEQAIKIIQDSVVANKDKFSIFAVSRYAGARPLGKGFKTGREEFAVRNNMTSTELNAADQIDKLLETVFSLSGLDAKRQLGGYWPHMRLWARDGWNPLDVGKFAGLPKEFIDWSHDRFRTGELDVYNLDPLAVTFKYIRGLLMKQEFDPILPDVVDALKTTKGIDERTFKLMSEYIEELKGRPHTSFGKVQQALQAGAHALGKDLPDTLALDVINTLSALAAAATIPFRPALILRNYYESMQKIAPRVGMGQYWSALRYVTGKETREEAYNLAKKAHAIVPGPQSIKSIHASSEVFGPGGAKLNYHVQSWLDKGFKWYQSADDWGRAIAFHAQRFRVHEAYGKYMKGKLDYEGFVEEAKILTFDPQDVQQAESLIKSGNIDDAANYLGWILSRETMNRYGHANHPAGWNSVYGRLLGQFGTWPVQYKDFLLQGLTRGTSKDKAEFAAIHFGVMGSTVAVGAAVGLNMTGWVGWPSLAYTGGPFAEMGIDAIKSISGSDLEKTLARRNLIAQVPVLGWAYTGNPRSVFLPGSYLLGDLVDAAKADDLFEATFEGSGFRLMQPDDKTALDWVMSL